MKESRRRTSVAIPVLTLRDMSQGLVTAPRSHAVIIMDLRGMGQIYIYLGFPPSGLISLHYLHMSL